MNSHVFTTLCEKTNMNGNAEFECIETIELYLRTQLAYYCGHTCGSLGYLNPDIYNEKYNDEKCIF